MLLFDEQCVCALKNVFFLLTAIAFLDTASPSPMNRKSVNVEFDTTIQFNSAEANRHSSIVNFLKSMVNNIYHSFSQNKDNPKMECIINFLQDMSRVFENYNEDDVSFVLNAIEEEFEGYNEEQGYYNPILFNDKLKSYIKTTIKDWVRDDGSFKLKINELLEKKNDTMYMDTQFFSLLSEIFSMEDLKQFRGFLKSFNEYPKHKNKYKLYSTVKDMLDFSIIKKYENMDSAGKARFSDALNQLFHVSRKKDYLKEGRDIKMTTMMEDFVRKKSRASNEALDSKGIHERAASTEYSEDSNGMSIKEFSTSHTSTKSKGQSCAVTPVLKRRGNEIASNIEVFRMLKLKDNLLRKNMNSPTVSIATKKVLETTSAIFY